MFSQSPFFGQQIAIEVSISIMAPEWFVWFFGFFFFATVTNAHIVSGLSNIHSLLSHSSRDHKSRKVSPGQNQSGGTNLWRYQGMTLCSRRTETDAEIRPQYPPIEN